MEVLDKITGKIEKVVNFTENSYEVTRTKLTVKGINCTNWFTKENFEKKFEIINAQDTSRNIAFDHKRTLGFNKEW